MSTCQRNNPLCGRAWLVIVLLVAVGLTLPSLGSRPAGAQGQRLVLAFYYNWFDENTWTSAKVPDFPAQPYASRDRGVMDRHIAQAQGAGIDAFVVSWYGPWGGVNNQTESNFAAMLDVAAARGFKLAVDIEAVSPFVGDTGAMVEMLRHALNVHANHPAYLRADGKPVLFFWRQQRWDAGTWQWIRDQVDPGHNSLWIAEGVEMAYQAVFDGHHLYSVTWSPPSDVFYTASKFSRYVQQARDRYGSYRYWVATAMPGYDDTRTGRGNAFARSREDGAYYGQTWQAAIASNPDWVIITSFNEWPEGTYIEPSQAYGDRYLQLTAEWASRFKSGAANPPPNLPPPGGGISSSSPSQGGGISSSSPSQGGGISSSSPSQGGGISSSSPSQGGGISSSSPSQGGGISSSSPSQGGGISSSSPSQGGGISSSSPSQGEAGRGSPVPTPTYAAVRIEAAALNVRMAPSVEAGRIAQVQAGQILRATARLADQSWWQVCCLNNRYGWVSGEWVEPIGPADKLDRVPTREIGNPPKATVHGLVPR